MRDYLSLLKVRYRVLLSQSSRAASRVLQLGRPVSDPAVLRHVRAGTTEECAPANVPSVTLPDGTRSDSATDICNVFARHFSERFTSDGWLHLTDQFYDLLLDFCGYLPRVAHELLEYLCAPATSEELHATLQAMKAASAPDPDGIPIIFYSTFLGAIQGALLRTVNGFIMEGIRSTSFRESRIVLIPKAGGNSSDPQSWRPISLLNSRLHDRCVIANAKNNLHSAWHNSPGATSSVPGRSVFLALSLTRDLFAFSSGTSFTGRFVSLDRVEHPYLFGILEALGFPHEIVSRLRLLYTDLNARLVVNGLQSAPFSVTRGIRQGCPLSPILFILCLDPILRRGSH